VLHGCDRCDPSGQDSYHFETSTGEEIEDAYETILEEEMLTQMAAELES
jgi:hypothetical protein